MDEAREGCFPVKSFPIKSITLEEDWNLLSTRYGLSGIRDFNRVEDGMGMA